MAGIIVSRIDVIMKKLLNLLCVCVLTGVFCTACAEPKFEERDVPFVVYYSGGSGDIPNVDFYHLIWSGIETLIINSDEELEECFTYEPPVVDFSKKTLIVACGPTIHGVYEANIKSLRQSAKSKFKLQVEVTLGETDAEEGWAIVLITDKIKGSSKFEIDVEFPDIWPE